MDNENIGPEEQIRICVIDDDHEVLKQEVRIFSARGFLVLPIAHPIGSANVIRKFDPHLIILDVMMPAINGDELYALLRRALKKLPPVIFYSGIDPEELEKLVATYRAIGFVYKGDGVMRLLSAVNCHLFGVGLLTMERNDGKTGGVKNLERKSEARE